jgi:hypothetical protein
MEAKDEAREITIDLRGLDVTVYLDGVEVNASPEAFHRDVHPKVEDLPPCTSVPC